MESIMEEITGINHVGLRVRNLTISREFYKRLGLTITERVEYNNAKFFFIRDPDNNVNEFLQPANL
jgi:lactoylglutathione lyase